MATTDTPSTALDIIKPGGYVALNQDASEARDIIEELLGGERLTERDLTTIKVPTSGGTAWEIPTPSGPEYAKEITGILLAYRFTHQYWEESEPNGEPPQCKSVGPETKAIGDGNPGGPCFTCPFNVMGSDPKGGIGKACTERELWFLLTANSMMPLVISFPPGSLSNIKHYRKNVLAGVPIRPTSCRTTIGLEGAVNKAGQKYSVAVARMSGMLDPAEAEAARGYATQFQPEIDAVVAAAVEADAEV